MYNLQYCLNLKFHSINMKPCLHIYYHSVFCAKKNTHTQIVELRIDFATVYQGKLKFIIHTLGFHNSVLLIITINKVRNSFGNWNPLGRVAATASMVLIKSFSITMLK